MISAKTVLKQQTGSRMTIGLLTDWIDDQYQLDLLYGIADYAVERDVNLLCFEGGPIQATKDCEARRNIVYELVSMENVDGLVILSCSIGNLADFDTITQFCKQYQPLPTVLVGHQIPGIPSLLVDTTGLRQLMDHLINVHHYRRFAFIKGVESSQEGLRRYETFLQALAEYNIPVDQQLIVPGNYTKASGEEAIRQLLDKNQAAFDVVIACNDDMASGAINELKTRGIKVPDEVAVAGFDNLDLCRFTSPSITTVGYSIYQLGRRAAEILLDILTQKPVPMFEFFPTKLIIRESCGCSTAAIHDFPVQKIRRESKSDVLEQLKTQQADKNAVIAELAHKLNNWLSDSRRINIRAIISELFTAFDNEINHNKDGEFFNILDKTLDKVLAIDGDISPWQTVISGLRNYFLPYLTKREILCKAEDLLQQARIIINDKALKKETFVFRQSIQINNTLSYLRERLLAAADEHKSMALLANTLPELGIKSCYIALFEGKKQNKSRLVLGYDEYQRFDNKRKKRFFSHALLPDNILLQNRRFTMLVVASNFTKPQLGYALFEIGPRDGRIYSELRRIIFSAIQISIFFQQLRKQANRLRIQKESLSLNIIQSRKVMTGFIQAIALTVESRDPYTAGHQHRVADLACAIAKEMKLSPDRIECIQMAGIVHDLGKIYIPAEILNKPGHLNELEFKFIKNHPQIAHDILEKIDFPWPIARIILQHHEKIDGSGYPFGLKGHDITLEAKILAVADVVEAMISHRPYRTAVSLDQALREIDEKRDILYDSEVVDQCLNLFRNKKFTFKDREK